MKFSSVKQVLASIVLLGAMWAGNAWSALVVTPGYPDYYIFGSSSFPVTYSYDSTTFLFNLSTEPQTGSAVSYIASAGAVPVIKGLQQLSLSVYIDNSGNLLSGGSYPSLMRLSLFGDGTVVDTPIVDVGFNNAGDFFALGGVGNVGGIFNLAAINGSGTVTLKGAAAFASSFDNTIDSDIDITTPRTGVPAPGALWLLLSGMAGLVVRARLKR